MRKKAAAVFCSMILGFPLAFQEKKDRAPEPLATEFKIPPEESRRSNPVKATPGSIAEGKHLFSSQCAMCHGKEGDGKGDLAEVMKLNLLDYRDPAALEGVTDGDLFYIVSKGKGQMPGQAERMKPEQRWNLINYIRSLAKKDSPRKPKEEKPR